MAEIQIGFQWLARQYELDLVQPLSSRSRMGTVRQREATHDQELLTWTSQYRPEDSFRGHFEFGLKYERLNFEFLSRLFARVDAEDVAQWVRDAPTGAYARRTAFLFEWFTVRRLDVPDTGNGVGYVDAIDPDEYLVGVPERSKRWRVLDNLPGTPAFCPLLYLGPEDARHWLYDVQAGVRKLDDSYGPELLLRCAAWLTFKESRASFAIEHEADQDDRVRRFAAAIARFSGHMTDVLIDDNLLTLQKSVLGESALRLGSRQSPVFVGQSTFRQQIVHFVAPDAEFVPGMLEGLRSFEARTRGSNTVVRTAAVSFAFVYLHPLADGNGRIHRFLINHLLAMDGAVPSNIIVPVSATIAGSAHGRADYDRVLEVFSKPLMQRYAGSCRFGERRTCPDGVQTDFEFLDGADAQHAWRFPDLSQHARYMSDVLQKTVDHEMAQEAHLLRTHDEARAALKSVVEMPDSDADRIMRSLKQSNWAVSGKLAGEYPDLFSPEGRLQGRSAKLISAVREAFEEGDKVTPRPPAADDAEGLARDEPSPRIRT